MIEPLMGLFGKVMAVDALLALLGSGALCVLSLLNFSRTGPRIKEEIANHFRAYTVFCLVRQTFWVFIILFWLAGFGQILYCSLILSGTLPLSWWGSILAGASSMLLLTALQFARHLFHIPVSLMSSFSYDIRKLYAFWSRLSAKRLSGAGMVIATVYLTGVVYAMANISGPMVAVPAFILGMWSLPWLFAVVPLPVRTHPGKRRASTAPPNLLLIGCDTLRVDRLLEDYPRDVAPFLKSLTRHSTLFARCYTPIARTAPSLATLLTGTPPERHGIVFNYVGDDHTRLPVKALPQILAESGYHTEAISDWSGSDLGKLSFGFGKTLTPEDQWNFKYLIRQGPKEMRLFLSLFTHNRFGRLFLPELFFMAGTPLTTELGGMARQRLSQLAEEEQPFCLTLFLGTCHPPFGSEHPYYRLYADPKYRGSSLFAMARLTDPFEIIRSQQKPREAFDLDQIIDLYDGCVRRFDDEVKALFHHLKQIGLDHNTIIVIFSDHGMELFEHGTWGQGNSAIGEQSNRIPLLLYDPQNQGRGRVSEIVRAMDLAPTLLQRCGITPPQTMEGVSLLDFLKGKAPLPKLTAKFSTGLWLARPPNLHPRHLSYPDIVELLHIPNRESGTLAIKPEYVDQIERARDSAVCRDHWKLVRLALNDTPDYLLFDLEADPECLNDVSNLHPDVVDKLKTHL